MQQIFHNNHYKNNNTKSTYFHVYAQFSTKIIKLSPNNHNKRMEIHTKNYNKQKNYLLLYLLYLSIYTYISYTYTILCLSPPQRPLYYEIITPNRPIFIQKE